MGWVSPPWLRVSSGLRPGGAQRPRCGVMWATSGDQSQLPDSQRAASAQARAAFDVILKMLTSVNYIFQSLALCWWGREKVFFKYKELFG